MCVLGAPPPPLACNAWDMIPCFTALQDFTEEQLQLYKEYQAKEKAAIEERLKRKAVMVWKGGILHTCSGSSSVERNGCPWQL